MLSLLKIAGELHENIPSYKVEMQKKINVGCEGDSVMPSKAVH